MNDSQHPRGVFVTRIGAIAATAGAAVGLGNIWRFPYEAGSGGGPFMLHCLLFTLLLGITVICSEFIIGRALCLPAYIGIVASLITLSSAAGAIDFEQQQYHDEFQRYVTRNRHPLYHLFIASLTSTILISGISVSYPIDETKTPRLRADWLSTALAVVFGTLCCLSFVCLSHVTTCGLVIFDLFNVVSPDIMLPVGGVITCIFVGWVLTHKVIGHRRCSYIASPLIAPTGIPACVT